MPDTIEVLDGSGDPVTVNTIDALLAAIGSVTGWSQARVKAAATTNATSVKASAGQVGGWYLQNRAASERFIKFYNKASAPTVGTDVPVFVVALQAAAGANVAWPAGISFTTGIAYAITTGVTDSDNTGVSVDDVHGVVLYK